MQAIQTEYKGYLFRSRLEARWAVFFDACGVRWEYEPGGYVIPDGQYYLPEFLHPGVEGRAKGATGPSPRPLIVSVKYFSFKGF